MDTFQLKSSITLTEGSRKRKMDTFFGTKQSFSSLGCEMAKDKIQLHSNITSKKCNGTPYTDEALAQQIYSFSGGIFYNVMGSLRSNFETDLRSRHPTHGALMCLLMLTTTHFHGKLNLTSPSYRIS